MLNLKEYFNLIDCDFSKRNPEFLLKETLSSADAATHLRHFSFLRATLNTWSPFIDPLTIDTKKYYIVRNNCERSIRHLLNKIGMASAESLLKEEFVKSAVLNLHRGGLCNRLRALSAFSVADINLNKFFFWQNDEACDAEFNSLFDESLLKNRISATLISGAEYADILQNGASLSLNDLSTAWSYWEKLSKDHEIWSGFRSRYNSTIADIFRCVTPSIRKEIDLIDSRFGLSNRVGIHIRRGDFVPYFKSKYGVDIASSSDLANYLFLTKGLKDIYLCCDDASFINEFIETSNNISHSISIVTSMPNFTQGRLRETSVESAVTDLVCLSKCQNIIGTLGSSFTEMAHSIWLSKSPNKSRELTKVAELEGVTSTI